MTHPPLPWPRGYSLPRIVHSSRESKAFKVSTIENNCSLAGGIYKTVNPNNELANPIRINTPAEFKLYFYSIEAQTLEVVYFVS